KSIAISLVFVNAKFIVKQIREYPSIQIEGKRLGLTHFPTFAFRINVYFLSITSIGLRDLQ
ncbi:MAG: hypothetical protein OEQ53_07970, partial [Saprospiraceae bacterium]|nr:hypothetical protein [Saprospiraceae bacterium]